MAKKATRKNVRSASEPSAMQALSAKLRKTVNNLRRAFSSYVDEFKIVSESRAELAPKFMKAFHDWGKETGGGTFAQFVRLFVPDLPEQSRSKPESQGYRDHPAYQAAEYLRRLAGRRQNAEGERETPVERSHRIANAPVSPTVAMARAMKTIMTLVPPDQARTLFDSLKAQLHWPDRTISRIENEARNIEPLVILREPRGVHALGSMRLVVPAMPATTTEEETPVARTA